MLSKISTCGLMLMLKGPRFGYSNFNIWLSVLRKLRVVMTVGPPIVSYKL